MKKPLFCVENDGYPLTPSVLAFADSHVTLLPPFAPRYDFPGLDLPLPYELFNPGLAHPPPGLGDGLRDSDIGMFGVPGIGSSVDRPEEKFESPYPLSMARPEGTVVAEDRRR